MPARKRNLLFVMTDHQRADSLGTVQSGVEVTPNLNALAERSAVFTRAYTTCPLCAPARTSLATGRYPTRTGIVVNDFKGEHAQDHRTLHEMLRDAGYRVGHVGVHHVRVKPDLRGRIDFAKWFAEAEFGNHTAALGIDYFAPLGRDAFRGKITENQGGRRVEVTYSNPQTCVWPHDPQHFKDLLYGREAQDFLRERSAEPFALFVNLWAPHPPLVVPEPYASRFDPARIDLPSNVGVPASGEPSNRRLGIAAQLAAGLSEADWRRVWAAHLGLVHLADDVIGRILRTLQEVGRADDTLLLFTVDHGDHLGQHAMYQKMEMYEQAIRIPLVVHVPGMTPRSVDAPVSHLDVVPTLAELLHLDAPDDLDGVSLSGALSGRADDDRTVFSQYSGNPVLGDCRRAAVTRRWKYVFDPDAEPELYDLDADPLEMTNLAAQDAHADVLRALHERCAEWHVSRGDRVFRGTPADGRP